VEGQGDTQGSVQVLETTSEGVPTTTETSSASPPFLSLSPSPAPEDTTEVQTRRGAPEPGKPRGPVTRGNYRATPGASAAGNSGTNSGPCDPKDNEAGGEGGVREGSGGEEPAPWLARLRSVSRQVPNRLPDPSLSLSPASPSWQKEAFGAEGEEGIHTESLVKPQHVFNRDQEKEDPNVIPEWQMKLLQRKEEDVSSEISPIERAMNST
jgi:hypothetical protein